MTYDLYIGDRAFSSWSLRGWLMLEAFDIPHRVHLVGLYSGTMAQNLAPLAPAKLVPVLRTPDGYVVGETLAMAEMLAEAHPDRAMWPRDPAARALARWMAAEMHAGFADLRRNCPMQLFHRYKGFVPAPEVQADLARIEHLIGLARSRHGAGGPWLFGAYSIADAFYAPVAARIAGYGLPVGEVVAEYVATTLAQPAFRRWRAEGLTVRYDPVPYAMALPTSPWPGPRPRQARAVADASAAENATCPYSGRPVTHALETGRRVFGFCNATCRDKILNDPDAWPAFAALLEQR